ncbi:MAG: hypothetical protein ACFB51_08280 [Anaerolineae bacterium]
MGAALVVGRPQPAVIGLTRRSGGLPTIYPPAHIDAHRRVVDGFAGEHLLYDALFRPVDRDEGIKALPGLFFRSPVALHTPPGDSIGHGAVGELPPVGLPQDVVHIEHRRNPFAMQRPHAVDGVPVLVNCDIKAVPVERRVQAFGGEIDVAYRVIGALEASTHGEPHGAHLLDGAGVLAGQHNGLVTVCGQLLAGRFDLGGGHCRQEGDIEIFAEGAQFVGNPPLLPGFAREGQHMGDDQHPHGEGSIQGWVPCISRMAATSSARRRVPCRSVWSAVSV